MTGYNPNERYQDCEYEQYVDSTSLCEADLAAAAQVMRDMADYLETNPRANLEITRTAHDAEHDELQETDQVTFRVWLEWPQELMPPEHRVPPERPRDE